MSSKRKHCDRCQRPLATCFCPLIISTTTQTQVIIWQHPKEQNHPKGTAKLLNLCLNNSHIVIGETLSASDLGIDLNHCALLYPQSVEGVPEVSNGACPSSPKQLLVIDSTWRKSRKIMHSNPWLSALPRFTIPPAKSQYRIRKAEKTNQLSTFEATVIALAQLESNTAQITALDAVFEKFVSHYESYLPKTHYPPPQAVGPTQKEFNQ